MTMFRSDHPKELEEGINTLFGLEYKQYPQQWKKLYESKNSKKAFEEDVQRIGFGAAPVKPEGQAVAEDQGHEGYTSRYTHETIALSFSITEEAEEDNLYGSLIQDYSKEMARALQHTQEIKGAATLNDGFTVNGGDGVPLFSASHPTPTGNQSNILATPADLSEAALEQMLTMIADMVNDRGLNIAAVGRMLVISTANVFTAIRLMRSNGRTGTPDNDLNAIKEGDFLPDGYHVVNRLVDPDAFYIKTDVPKGLRFFNRRPLKKGMEPDFTTGNWRYKVSQRYSFGRSDWRGMVATPGA